MRVREWVDYDPCSRKASMVAGCESCACRAEISRREEQPQEIDVDRPDAFVTFVVRLENTEHLSRVPEVVLWRSLTQGHSERSHLLVVTHQQDVANQYGVVPCLAIEDRELRHLLVLVGRRADESRVTVWPHRCACVPPARVA